MKISVSFLSIEESLIPKLVKLNKTSADFFHFDIMDGDFVENKTRNFAIDTIISKVLKKPYDVHLMVKDVKKYVDDYSKLKPTHITFHLEVGNTKELIEYVKEKNIEVGISLKPATPIKDLLPYLKDIDVVLVMSVEPGKGGQEFLEEAVTRIDYLEKYRHEHNLAFMIQVDGGINDETIKKCQNADIAVVGSYIVNSENYEEQISKL